MPKLVYHDSEGIEKTITLGAEPVLIGRANECQIQTQDAMVSRRHARIGWDGNYWIEDLGSSNGVYVGPEKVQRSPIRPGDVFTCGSLVMRLLPDTTPRMSNPQMAVASALPPPPAPAGPGRPQAAPTLQPPPKMAPPSAPPPAAAMLPAAQPLRDSGELESERRRRKEAEAALLEAAERARVAEEKLEQAQSGAREAAQLKRKVEQLTADLRRLRGGKPVEEEPSEDTRDEAERALRLAAETERDRLRDQVVDLEQQLAARPSAGKAAAPAAGAVDSYAELRDSLAELRASLRAANEEAGLLTAPESSVAVVVDSLRTGADQLEGARANLRMLGKLLGLG